MMRFLRLSAVKWLVVRVVVPVADLLLAPLTLAAAALLKAIRRVGVYRMPVSRRIFNSAGVFPIRDHYYEPMFNPRHLRRPLEEERRLPGVDLNEAGQLALLAQFEYAAELARLPLVA